MGKFKYLKIKEKERLPKNSGVYIFKDEKEILYIGKAVNLKERVKNHFQQPVFRDNLFINQTKRIGYLKTDSEIEALILEANLIKKYQPRYNVLWKDNKNYFFLVKSKEEFPKIFLTHQVRNQKIKADSVGPFVDGKALKETIKILRKVFPYRSCKTLPKRACLWYHLDRCLAPCLLESKILEISQIKEKIKKEVQRNANSLFEVIKKGKSQVLKNLKKEMLTSVKSRDFEKAARIRDQIFALEKVFFNAKIFSLEVPKAENWLQIQKELKKILNLEKEINRIEAYDVSNIQGQKATGSMVVFSNGLPDKNSYRKFKIRIEGSPNDVAMIKEVLRRRLCHQEWPYPELILIDGGKAQLNAVKSVVGEFKNLNIPLTALAKKENKLFIEGKKESLFLKNLPREIFNLVLQLRDEAHRFALSYHRKLRIKSYLPMGRS